MAFNIPNYLTQAEVVELLSVFNPNEKITVTRFRYRNKEELTRSEEMTLVEFHRVIAESFEEGHLPGGDLEVYIPLKNQTLVGHHDGVYWLKQKISNS